MIDRNPSAARNVIKEAWSVVDVMRFFSRCGCREYTEEEQIHFGKAIQTLKFYGEISKEKGDLTL